MQDSLNNAASAFSRAIRGSFASFPRFEVEEMRSRGWASATFTGARHELRFRVEGAGADEAAARFLGGLEAAEFDLRGHIVADLALVSEERRPGFARIAVEALTVEEG
jgi:hypothetical protein